MAGEAGNQGEYLQDPLLPLLDRHLSERLVDVHRNVLVHAKIQNLGCKDSREVRADVINVAVHGQDKIQSFLFTLPSL